MLLFQDLAAMLRALISLSPGDLLLDSLAVLGSYLWAGNHTSLLNDATAVIFVEVYRAHLCSLLLGEALVPLVPDIRNSV
jgi:hypothetical protein